MAQDSPNGSASGLSSARADADRGSSFASELERDRAHREKARSTKPLRRLNPLHP